MVGNYFFTTDKIICDLHHYFCTPSAVEILYMACFVKANIEAQLF